MNQTHHFQQAIDLIDKANAADPTQEQDGENSVPKELLYSQRMTNRLQNFAPDASEILQLAARAQHIQRWLFPRSDYPQGRQGYKQWRIALAKFHAEKAAAILLQAGYKESDGERVKDLLQKKRLKHDDEVQTLEDVICLVFIEYYLADFARKHREEKLIGIIQKTWKKMSSAGHSAALTLPLSPQLNALVEKALSAN